MTTIIYKIRTILGIYKSETLLGEKKLRMTRQLETKSWIFSKKPTTMAPTKKQFLDYIMLSRIYRETILWTLKQDGNETECADSDG